jgi:hypothetical protein
MESTPRINVVSQRFLQVSIFMLLLSRAWQYLYWDSPLRTLLWDEDLISTYVSRLGWTWTEWVTSPRASLYIDLMTSSLGVGFLIAASGVFIIHKAPVVGKVLLVMGGVLCLFHALLDTKAHFGRIGHFAELSLQWFSPFLLVFLFSKYYTDQRFHIGIRVAIALTFIGHGLYAWGYYPVPGHFQQMMISGFGVTNSQALILLKIAGFLDFMAAALLFVPAKKWAFAGLYYIIIWGFLTAMARMWSNLELSSMSNLFAFWLSETTVRFVHFLVPLALLFWWKEKKGYLKW